jgi:hypothetical protein
MVRRRRGYHGRVHRTEHAIRIAADPQAVFDVIVDWRRVDEYFVGIRHVRPLDHREHGVGSTFDVELHVGPLRQRGRIEVTEHDPPRGWRWRTTKGPSQDGWWTIAAVGRGSEVRLGNEFHYSLRHGGRPAEAIAVRLVDRTIKQTLANLKRLVEEGR